MSLHLGHPGTAEALHATGRVAHRIRVDAGPHGLCGWPQPGTYSLGHTGNLR